MLDNMLAIGVVLGLCGVLVVSWIDLLGSFVQ